MSHPWIDGLVENADPGPVCPACDDGSGVSVFPYYGLAPHRHDLTITGSVIGSTVFLPKSDWPANYRPDRDDDGDETHGVYTHCLSCGAK